MTLARWCSVIPNISSTTCYDRSIRQRNPPRRIIKRPGLMSTMPVRETV